MMGKWKFLVVGCGSIGIRHIQNLKAIGGFQILAFDIDKSRTEEAKQRFGVSSYNSFKEALDERPDAVLVCTPNSLHMRYAIPAAKAGCHLFIEKPVSHSLDGIDELIRVLEEKRSHFLMGSNWKFHPSFRLMKGLLEEKAIGRVLSFTIIFGQYLPDWHPQEDYRKGYSANKSLGGGVLLDSHEFDYLQWFLGPIEKISCFYGKYSNLEIDTEDIAQAVVETKNGAFGGVHLDYIQQPSRRAYCFYGEEGTLEWSYREKKVSLYKASEKKWQYFKENKNYDLNQMYIDELKHFIAVLEGREESITDIFTAMRVLKIIETAKTNQNSIDNDVYRYIQR